ncbi:MAG: nucleotidyltransferase domain-containing protein [Candidatus Thorarchaeota archaeon]
MSMEDALTKVIERAQKDEDILAVIVYGSFARGEKYQDIDITLVIWPRFIESVNYLQKEIDYSFDGLDIHIFQDLPLYIQARVLEEGIIKLQKNEDEYFDLVMTTLQRWGDFKPHFTLYLEEVLSGPKDHN